jgi:hypothetical protein
VAFLDTKLLHPPEKYDKLGRAEEASKDAYNLQRKGEIHD